MYKRMVLRYIGLNFLYLSVYLSIFVITVQGCFLDTVYIVRHQRCWRRRRAELIVPLLRLAELLLLLPSSLIFTSSCRASCCNESVDDRRTSLAVADVTHQPNRCRLLAGGVTLWEHGFEFDAGKVTGR